MNSGNSVVGPAGALQSLYWVHARHGIRMRFPALCPAIRRFALRAQEFDENGPVRGQNAGSGRRQRPILRL